MDDNGQTKNGELFGYGRLGHTPSRCPPNSLLDEGNDGQMKGRLPTFAEPRIKRCHILGSSHENDSLMSTIWSESELKDMVELTE